MFALRTVYGWAKNNKILLQTNRHCNFSAAHSEYLVKGTQPTDDLMDFTNTKYAGQIVLITLINSQCTDRWKWWLCCIHIQ